MHPLLRALALILLIPLTLIRLPGVTVFVVLRLAARMTARPPELTGKDATGQPAPADMTERRAFASYRKAKRWLDGGLAPTRPDTIGALAVMTMVYGWEAYGLSLPIDGTADWHVWTAFLDAAAAYLAVMGVLRDRRDMTCTVDGLDANMRRVRAKWPANRTRRILAAAGVGVALGLVVWWFTGGLWTMLLFASLGALTQLNPVFKADRRRFQADYRLALTLHRWWNQLDVPPFKGKPGIITNTRQGGDGYTVATMKLGNGTGSAPDWVNSKTMDALAGVTQQDGRLAAFTYDGDDRTRVIVAIRPDQHPDPMSLLADPVALTAALTVDEARMCKLYGAIPGRIRLTSKPVATRDGKPAMWTLKIEGSNASWQSIGRDWIKGDTGGAFGDWMNMDGLTVIPDPGEQFGWICPDQNWGAYQWDGKTMAHWMSDELTERKNPARYMTLIAFDKAIRTSFASAVAQAKLDGPSTIFYDKDTPVASRDGWRFQMYPMNIPQSGHTVSDYLRVDYRSAFADAPVADALPVVEDGHASNRKLLFALGYRDEAGGAPERLDDVDGEDAELAWILCSRACARLVKTPPIVGQPTCLTFGDTPVWLYRITLVGGVTPADMRRVQERIKAALGASFAAWDWVDPSTVDLWAGPGLPDGPDEWLDVDDMHRLDRLLMDSAWAAAKAVGADGRPVTTLRVNQYKGALVKAEFALPAGLGPDGALKRLDAFAATSGWRYTRVIPSDQPDTGLTLLLAHHDPLPARAMADWTVMRADPASTVLPFGVGDDGSVVSFDPHDTAHLLVSGMTMSGKTSAAVTLVNGALLHGWRAFVGDPVKNGNDFAPIRDKCSGFATGLDQCAAMLQWVDMEGRRRLDLQKQYGVQNIDGLPDEVRPPRIIVFLDEFNSLLELSKGAKRNPTGDPAIDNENAMEAWRDGCKNLIGTAVSHILTQHRAQGITIILGAQQLSVESMKAMPNAGTAKSQLGRLFIGAGNPAGNVSDNNIGEANRLIRQALQAGGMPKGRGLYERMGRGLQMVQCWWCGQPDDIAGNMSTVPDMEPVDWTDLLPAKPRLVGVVDEDQTDEPVETVTVDDIDSDDDGWEVD